MALAMGRRGDRQARSLRLGAAAGVAAALAALLVVALFSSRSSDGGDAHRLAARQSAVMTWEDAVHPLVQSGGQVVALGPRTAATDLTQHRISEPQLQTMATAWVSRLAQLRQQLAAVQTPSSLRAAHDLLDTAMAGYVTASRDLLAAASAPPDRRTQLLSDAAAAGNAADRVYDQAMAAIAKLRSSLDLPTDWSGS